MDGPTDKSPGPFFGPADCGLRTLDLSLARRTGEYYYFHGGSKNDRGIALIFTEGGETESMNKGDTYLFLLSQAFIPLT